MKSFSMIEALWREHARAPFPEGLAGAEVEGIGVTSLDSFTAGCIETFLSRGGKLDVRRTAVLGLCYRDLGTVAPALEGERRQDFGRLEQLARMVLEAVRDGDKPAERGAAADRTRE